MALMLILNNNNILMKDFAHDSEHLETESSDAVFTKILDIVSGHVGLKFNPGKMYDLV